MSNLIGIGLSHQLFFVTYTEAHPALICSTGGYFYCNVVLPCICSNGICIVST